MVSFFRRRLRLLYSHYTIKSKSHPKKVTTEMKSHSQELKSEEEEIQELERELKTCIYLLLYAPRPLPIAYIEGYGGQTISYIHPLFKILAWSIICIVVLCSSGYLLKFGIHFGMIKCFLWIVTFVCTLLITIFLFEPIRVFCHALINSLCWHKPINIRQRFVAEGHLVNPKNRIKKMEMLNYRMRNAILYGPLPFKKLNSRLRDVKYDLEMRNLVGEILLYGTLLISSLYLVTIEKTSMSYLNYVMVEDVFLNGSYTETIHFQDVCTYEMFLDYLNKTLLPTLLLNSMKDLARENENKTSGDVDEQLDLANNYDDYRYKRQITPEYIGQDILDDLLYDKRNTVYERGWTLNANVKMLGIARLRQVRVKTSNCREYRDLEARNLECAPPMSLEDEETGDFSLYWAKEYPKGLSDAQSAPWKFRSAYETGSVVVFGKLATYFGGGYIIEIPKDLENARLTIEFLDTFQWVDIRTRVVFVEFALYCPNTNLFSTITLVFERSATGYFIPTSRVSTCNFMRASDEYHMMSFILTLVFYLAVLVLCCRVGLKIHRTSLMDYILRSITLVDVTLVVSSVLGMLSISLRSGYLTKLFRDLEASKNNQFISFDYAVLWHNTSVYLLGILVFFTSFKLLSLLTYRVILYQFQYTLVLCYERVFTLLLQTTICFIGFAMMFQILLIDFNEVFSSLGLALAYLIGRKGFHDPFDISVPSATRIIGPLSLALFVFLLCFVFYHLILASIFYNFHKFRYVELVDKYNVADYIKHWVTLKRQNDVMHLREKFLPSELDVLRLKGGGQKLSTPKWWCTAFQPLWSEPDYRTQVPLYDFITPKYYDATEYMNLDSVRLAALQNLMLILIAHDQRFQLCFAEKALRTLFIAYTMKRRVFDKTVGHYFFVIDKDGRLGVSDRLIFNQMKKVVESYAVKKNFILDEDPVSEMVPTEEILEQINQKLTLLLRKYAHKLERH